MRKSMLNRSALLALMAAALVLLAAASPAKADTIYTTGGTPPSYIPGSGDTLSTDAYANVYVYAQSFVPTETATLIDVQLPLSEEGGSPPPPNEVTVYIESSTTGGAPSGTKLDTLGPTGSISSTTAQIFTVTCATCSTLTVRTTYFVVVDQTSGPDPVLWNLISPETFGTQYFNASGSTTTFSSEAPPQHLWPHSRLTERPSPLRSRPAFCFWARGFWDSWSSGARDSRRMV